MKKILSILGTALLVVLVIVPIGSFAGTKKIWVDDDSKSSKEDGSWDHPYKSLSRALEKADSDDEVHIKEGTYKGEFKIPKGVNVYGAGKDKVFLKGKDGQPVVRMKHKSKINGVTISGGKHGIVVDDGATKAEIISVIVKDNDSDGIKINAGTVAEKYTITIWNTEIYDNGRTGIYSEKRKLTIGDTYVGDNGSDGIDIAAGSSVWMKGNTIKDNRKSGMKIAYDGSWVWVGNTTIRDNGREGVEINSYGGTGTVTFHKNNKFYKNARWGVVRVQRSGTADWNRVTFTEMHSTQESKNIFWDNGLGALSPIAHIKKQ